MVGVAVRHDIGPADVVTARRRPVDRLRSGLLGRAGGVAVLPGLPDTGTMAAMAREALASGSVATRQCGPTQVVDDGRRDVPGRALGSGPGGPVQDALYRSPSLHRVLAEWCGVALMPTGGRGSYSYYTRPGDHLAVHVDVAGCDVTLITVVHDSAPPGDPGGCLVAFTDDVGTPLSTIRAGDRSSAMAVRAERGSSILILGGLVPHAVLPLGERGTRVISALCFEAVEGGVG